MKVVITAFKNCNVYSLSTSKKQFLVFNGLLVNFLMVNCLFASKSGKMVYLAARGAAVTPRFLTIGL